MVRSSLDQIRGAVGLGENGQNLEAFNNDESAVRNRRS